MCDLYEVSAMRFGQLLKTILFPSSCLLPIGEIHADENQGGTDEEEDGDALVEYQPRKDNRGDGIDVNVVGGRDGTDGLQRPVPRHEAHH